MVVVDDDKVSALRLIMSLVGRWTDMVHFYWSYHAI